MTIKNCSVNSRNIIEQFIADTHCDWRLTVFDFDDTLVRTDSQVTVVHEDGTTELLTPGQYAVYEKRPGDTLDYSAFRTLVNPRIIKHVGRHLKWVYDAYGPSSILVLTARGGDMSYIQDFLADAGFPGIDVVGLGCEARTTPAEKASYVAELVRGRGLKYVEFFDDCDDNVAAVDDLKSSFPTVKFVTQTIKLSL